MVQAEDAGGWRRWRGRTWTATQADDAGGGGDGCTMRAKNALAGSIGEERDDGGRGQVAPDADMREGDREIAGTRVPRVWYVVSSEGARAKG